MIFFANSDRGLCRSRNEDAFASASLTDGSFFCAVFDGMGGAVGGEVASALARDAFLDVMKGAAGAILADKKFLLTKAALAADRAVRGAVAADPSLEGMGTTVTAAVFAGDRLYVLNVGDSRAYLYRGDRLLRLTRDDSYVESLVVSGELTPEAARNHPMSHVITRAVGLLGSGTVTAQETPLRPHDVVLLCTDGLHGMLEDGRIGKILSQSVGAAEAVGYLIAAANECGGKDNITAAVTVF